MELLEKILVGIIVGIIVTLIVSPILAYVAAESPNLHLSNGCDDKFNNNSPFQFYVENKGNVGGVGTVCMESEDILFKNVNNSSTYCFPEKNFLSVSSGLIFSFKAEIMYKNETSENVTIKIIRDCKSKVWRIFPKKWWLVFWF